MLKATIQIPRGSVIDRCIIDYKTPEDLSRMPRHLQGGYFFNSVSNQDPNDVPRLISRTEADELFLSKRCKSCLDFLNSQTEENNKFVERQMKLLDLFAGGGGLSLGLSSKSRIFNAVSLDISPSAALTLR
jgi:hypothetical protein